MEIREKLKRCDCGHWDIYYDVDKFRGCPLCLEQCKNAELKRQLVEKDNDLKALQIYANAGDVKIRELTNP